MENSIDQGWDECESSPHLSRMARGRVLSFLTVANARGGSPVEPCGNVMNRAPHAMDTNTLGRGLLYLGLGLALLGGLVLLLGRVVHLGNLPGDLVYEGQNVRVYVPIATMIVLSVVLTLLLNLVLRLFR